MSDIRAWVDTATRAAGEGRWQDAERAWHRVLSLDPKHPQALYSIGVHAFQRGRFDEALRALQAANAAAPGDPVVLLSISRVLGEMGDREGEHKAIDAALAADPYFLPGLLTKAVLLERAGQARAATVIYRNALKIAPPEPQWPPSMRKQLTRGRALVERYGNELASFLAERAGTRLDALTAAEAQRWREAGAILSGQSQPYPSICNQLHVPRLPAIPFFERSQFDWVEALEARTAAITEELQAALAAQGDEFRPYVAYAPGAPVNQWHELNHSKRWSSYFLWNNGAPVEEHLSACPQTAQALADAGQADIPGM